MNINVESQSLRNWVLIVNNKEVSSTRPGVTMMTRLDRR